MQWQTRRRILYGFGFLFLFAAITIYFLRDIIFPVPMCTDKKQNGYEVGIDCGGVCINRCSSEVIPLAVLWTRALKTSDGVYDIAAMLSNKNIDHAAKNVWYVFTLYDEKGEVMKEIKGVTVTPVNGDFPILEQSIALPKNPSTVTVRIEDSVHYNVNEKSTVPTISVSNERYEGGSISRVYLTVQNKKRSTITNLPIKVVLFDENNNAYAVGQTLVPELGKEESKVVSFVWHNTLPQAPVRIRAYPIFDPFLSLE